MFGCEHKGPLQMTLLKAAAKIFGTQKEEENRSVRADLREIAS